MKNTQFTGQCQEIREFSVISQRRPERRLCLLFQKIDTEVTILQMSLRLSFASDAQI